MMGVSSLRSGIIQGGCAQNSGNEFSPGRFITTKTSGWTGEPGGVDTRDEDVIGGVREWEGGAIPIVWREREGEYIPSDGGPRRDKMHPCWGRKRRCTETREVESRQGETR